MGSNVSWEWSAVMRLERGWGREARRVLGMGVVVRLNGVIGMSFLLSRSPQPCLQ